MLPLAELTGPSVRSVLGLFTDLDDTLTWEGRLVPGAYQALCDAVDAGLTVVLVTGRPGGWAETLAALLPVAGVIAENGGLAVLRSGETLYWDDLPTRQAQQSRLALLTDDLRRRLPFARLAADQPLRRVDVAFDVGEAQRLDAAQVAELTAAIAAHGARALVSTVHAHAFYGDHDKAKMIVRLAAHRLATDEETLQARYLFVGDSPNDQAGFAYFPTTVGVANCARYEARLAPPPRYVTPSPGGHGFAELVRHLLARRA